MTKYFKGLDTLRAIAALVVVWGHMEKSLKKKNLVPFLSENNSIIFPNSHIAVILFFVLSGFLITYLLVNEKEKMGAISLKNFYLRRILRIWLLYYMILLLSYILFKPIYTTGNILLCLSIFPNVARALSLGWTVSPQIWSIGVEEQFYLLWPIILIMLPEKKVITALILFFIGYSIFPHFLSYFSIRYLHDDGIVKVINKFFFGTKFNCMALGSLIGYSYAKDKSWLKIFNKELFILLTIVVSFGLWFFHFELKYFNDEFYAILFSIMILGIVKSEQINIDTRLTKFLGKISYGIYMYHWIIILFAFKFLKYEPGNQIIFNIKLYSIVVFGTIFTAWLSHVTLEKYFLDLKKQFSTI